MARHVPDVRFERYADDAICHCASEEQATTVWRALAERLAECGLTLHPEKTRIVYGKDSERPGDDPCQTFDFLGDTFRPRWAKDRSGRCFVSFTPAASGKALKRIRQTVRQRRLHRRSDKTRADLARMFNAEIRGWIAYYSRYHRSAMFPTLQQIDRYLVRWICGKYKRFRRHPRRARQWLVHVMRREPGLFAHWTLLRRRATAG
jgi:RNA-directed DNA polymerase